MKTNAVAGPPAGRSISNAPAQPLKSAEAALTGFLDRKQTGTASPPATNAPATTNQPRSAAEALTNASFLPLPGAAGASPTEPPDWHAQFEAARLMLRQTNAQQAIVTLVNILESDAPEDLKRPALLELALASQQEKQFPRALQILAQYVQRYPKDSNVPEVLLRQGMVYREMGANVPALSKFYAVLSSALSLKSDRFAYYQRLVLQAQTEIADTYFLDGQYQEAADFLARLLKLDNPELNKARIHYKLVRSLACLGRRPETVAAARDFLKAHPQAEDQPEARFILATTLKQMGRNHEALQEVLLLLESQRALAAQNPAHWNYWQQRTGNDIANELYREGDYTSALEVYFNLARLDSAPAWQLPVWYQIGLVYERLKQPQKAAETYELITSRAKDLGPNPSPSMKALLDMARWRGEFLKWHTNAEHTTARIGIPPPAKPEPAQTADGPSGE